MKDLKKIIAESVHESINKLIKEEADIQNKLCEQVMIDEGLWNGIKSMWNGAKAIGGELMNAGAYGKQSTYFQLQLQKINNANQVIQDMAKQGVINDSTLRYWNAQLGKYVQYLNDNIKPNYNGDTDYRRTQAPSYQQVQQSKFIGQQISKLQQLVSSAKAKGDYEKAVKYMDKIESLQKTQAGLQGRQQSNK